MTVGELMDQIKYIKELEEELESLEVNVSEDIPFVDDKIKNLRTLIGIYRDRSLESE